MAPTLRLILGKAGPFIGLILVIVLFSVPAETREYFLTYHNFKIILTQTVIVAVGAPRDDDDHRQRRPSTSPWARPSP